MKRSREEAVRQRGKALLSQIKKNNKKILENVANKEEK